MNRLQHLQLVGHNAAAMIVCTACEAFPDVLERREVYREIVLGLVGR